MKTIASLVVVLICFAANSLITRFALIEGRIDPKVFTAIRLMSGGVTLLPIVLLNFKKVDLFPRRHLISAIALSAYAFFFSLAYVSLDTGLGALILFTTVQLTMFGVSSFKGVKFTRNDFIGVTIALIGLTIIFLPGSIEFDLSYSVLMVLSGVAWGSYCLVGAKSKHPIFDGAMSFVLSLPFAVCLLVLNSGHFDKTGVWLAVLSGSCTSGMAYSLWYLVSSKIHISLAAISQTTVPIIATFMGISFLNESLSVNFVVAAFCVVFGIFIKNVGEFK